MEAEMEAEPLEGSISQAATAARQAQLAAATVGLDEFPCLRTAPMAEQREPQGKN